MARPLVLAAATALALVACGPSLRLSHRGNAYFEQCYAGDLDPLVPDAERRACWQAWYADYQLGASDERIDYVRERLAMLDPERRAAIALATGDTGEPEMLDGVGDLDTQDGVASPDASLTTPEGVVADGAPIDTTPHDTTPDAPYVGPTASEAAPEDVAHVLIVRDERHRRAAERHLHRGILVPRSQTPRCAAACQPGWQACTSRCTADEHGCVAACRRDFTLCSRSCY